MDPDKVDAETGNFWRALYKLEKQFGDVPNAQKIAAKVKWASSVCPNSFETKQIVWDVFLPGS